MLPAVPAVTALGRLWVAGSVLLIGCNANATTSPSTTPSPSPAGTIAASPTSTLEAAPTFTPSDTIQIEAGDWGVVTTADLNEDGNLDIIGTTHSPKNGIAVLSGLGDGTFEAAPVEVAPADYVIAADLDADGHMDLISTGDRVAVLHARGDGTFEPPNYYGPDPDPAAELNFFGIAAADLNGDGFPDLVTANWGRSELHVLLGKGDGTFNSAATYTCLRCISVGAADLDLDGDIDVVTTSFSPFDHPGVIYVFANDGLGAFPEPAPVGPDGNSHGLGLGDLNQDGAVDLVTGNNQSFTISVLLGTGDGGFSGLTTYAAGNSHTVAVADFDQDGALDVVSGSIEHNKLWFYRGVGDGSLVETSGIDTTPFVAGGVTVGDFNGDGRLDFALAQSAGGRQFVKVFLAQ